MKSLISLLFLLLALNTFAGTCQVSSWIHELETGINKEVICEEAYAAITGSYEMKPGSILTIEAFGQRSMYSVELTKIKLISDSEVIFDSDGVLFWSPDSSYVQLN